MLIEKLCTNFSDAVFGNNRGMKQEINNVARRPQSSLCSSERSDLMVVISAGRSSSPLGYSLALWNFPTSVCNFIDTRHKTQVVLKGIKKQQQQALHSPGLFYQARHRVIFCNCFLHVTIESATTRSVKCLTAI